MERKGKRTTRDAFLLNAANPVRCRGDEPRAALPADGESFIAVVKDTVAVPGRPEGHLDRVGRTGKERDRALENTATLESLRLDKRVRRTLHVIERWCWCRTDRRLPRQ